ncbi:hypothetical protein AQUCO_10900001v1 [Aquilegia coerulea]|uniref:Glutamyl/glutaminyl-tRNA synthetase class Ib catalytic domain-containing protein n=1 Tax=Aquilegia coerulea TaxID=218851 RepID=A0A2G5C2Z6_AQUCA|nr:hypothetical protein AQUCO_10900001v1 [Aquilegia coerulea]
MATLLGVPWMRIRCLPNTTTHPFLRRSSSYILSFSTQNRRSFGVFASSSSDVNLPEKKVNEVRVRFAFSPTGNLHVGGARTALFNYLFARLVSWGLETLGDFVIMRSNGQPVYNFCVTVDDATMAISHVIRAEEHLPNTLRQALIYQALGFPMPHFAHVSLILAPDRSNCRNVMYKEMRYLPQAMVNYLALLGWGDGTAKEFFTLQKLVEAFTIDRVNKSGAIFDSTKLRWMNGQHLRALPPKDLIKLVGERWMVAGILKESEAMFIQEAVELLKDGIDLVTDADSIVKFAVVPFVFYFF